jgi:NTP pyrophosphatase (non-canonical NTP hydrolase)
MKCSWKIRAHPEEFVKNKIAITKLKYATASVLDNSYDSGIAKPDTVFHASEWNDSHLRPSSFNNLLSSFAIEVDNNMSEILQYTMEKNWNKFDQPRNLVLAILNEIGELLQVFLWRNDGPSDRLDNEVRMCAAYELADILIFSMRFGFYMDFSLDSALMAIPCATLL